MLDVKCKACGKRYNYHECGCCPNCGAYNRPPRRQQVTAQGDVYHVSDGDDQEQRTESLDKKVCYEKKDCYEDQAHTSTVYRQPSAYEDGYRYMEDETTDYEEVMDERFEAAARHAQTQFQDAEDRMEELEDENEPVEHHNAHVKTVNFDVDDLGQKLSSTFGGLMNNLQKKSHKGYTEKTGSRSSESGAKVIRIVVKVVVAIIILNVVFGLLGTVLANLREGGLDDFFQEEITTEPVIPEKFSGIYENMEWLGESMSLLGNQNVYSAEFEKPFVIGESVGEVDDYDVDSGEDIYGWGQIVTVKVHWMEGVPNDPILMNGDGGYDWTSNYYWEMDENQEGYVYQFLIDSEDENMALKLIFEDYSVEPSQEVQIDLQ